MNKKYTCLTCQQNTDIPRVVEDGISPDGYVHFKRVCPTCGSARLTIYLGDSE